MPSTTTLSNRITKIVMITCASVILLTLVVAVIIQGTNLRNSMIDKMSTLAKVLGEASKESLALKLKYQAAPILETLRTEPTIEAAYLFDTNDVLFSQYINHSTITFAKIIQRKTFQVEALRQAKRTHSTIYNFTLRNFCLYSPIVSDGEYIGGVYLQASVNTILINQLWFLVAALIILLVSLLVAYLLTVRLKPLIIEPLLQLVARMQTVTENKIYTLQPQPLVDNNIKEIRELQAGFDEMLTQINNRQDELQKHSQLLEDKVIQRTFDLQHSNQELRKTVTELDIARKEAVEASAAKSLFLANMSHEIRTPMIGVLGMAELLLKSTSDNYQSELARTIHSSGESLLSILNDLLDISKIEAGKLELELNNFNPVDTLEDTVELLADNAFAKGLEITNISAPHLPEVLLGDAGRLRQIILNLLSNAIKFTAQGRISIVMSSAPLTDTTIELTIAVRDTGIGIHDQAKEKIFAAFTQADSSTTRNFGGTGLGLTIVTQLVDLMGGSIAVTDNHPQGSCFTVRLPLTCVHNPALSAQSQRSCNNKHALLVTDNPDLELLLQEQLTAWGCTTTTISPQQLPPQTTTACDYIFIDKTDSAQPATLNFTQNHHSAQQTKIIMIAQHRYALSDAKEQESDNFYLVIKPVKIKALKKIMLQDSAPYPSSTPNNHPSTSLPVEHQIQEKAVKILLAEDNQTNQRLAQLILEQNGYQLTMVSNGKEAVEATKTYSFDLILMDCQMPVMDGYAAAQIISADSNIPIIALTAHASDKEIAQCSQAGMTAYLCKPYKQRQLLDLVEKFAPNS
ncbi:MAG: ATP-binding protein [Desulfuromonas sp.]|nr:ATP-binding protein [Desulfuromonas sp.]